MKINVITTEAGKIISRNTIIKLNVNPFDIEGTKVPISLYQKKGDLLVAKGYSNPAAIDVGSDGQVLVSDSTEAAGVKWKTMQLGTITLSNSESFAIPSGTVVTQGTTSGTIRIATSADTTNLYVASEDILPSEDGVLYMILVNPEKVVRRVMILGINHSRMDEIAALTASDLKQVVDSVMGQNLTYIIGDGSPW
jgi:hypothetical protein